MIIPANILRPLLSKLSVTGADSVVWEPADSLMYSVGSSLTAVVVDPILKSDFKGLAVSSKQLSSVMRRASGDVEITEQLGGLLIRVKKSKHELPGVPHKDLGAIPEPKIYYAVYYEHVSDLVGFSLIASGKETFDFTGAVQLLGEDGTLISSGTDKLRVAVAERKSPVTGLPQFNIPYHAALAIKEFAGHPGLFTIGESNSSLVMRSGDDRKSYTVYANKFVKTAPDMRKLIPKEFTFKATVEASELAEALKNVEPAVGDKEKTGFLFDQSSETLTLTATSPNGVSEDSLLFRSLKPDPMFDDPVTFGVSLNHKHLMDFLDKVSGVITVSGTGARAPVYLEAGEAKILLAAFH